jgi:hypothetical protein
LNHAGVAAEVGVDGVGATRQANTGADIANTGADIADAGRREIAQNAGC